MRKAAVLLGMLFLLARAAPGQQPARKKDTGKVGRPASTAKKEPAPPPAGKADNSVTCPPTPELTVEQTLQSIASTSGRIEFLACQLRVEQGVLSQFSSQIEIMNEELKLLDARSVSLLQEQAKQRQGIQPEELLKLLELQETQIKLLGALPSPALPSPAYQSPEDSRTVQRLNNLETFKESFCSAMRFSLIPNGGSTTPSGSRLWSACN